MIPGQAVVEAEVTPGNWKVIRSGSYAFCEGFIEGVHFAPEPHPALRVRAAEKPAPYAAMRAREEGSP